jgi:hypothetical protein
MQWQFENTTNADIGPQNVGTVIPALSTITVSAGNWFLWAESDDIDTYLDSGDVVFKLDGSALDAFSAKAVIHSMMNPLVVEKQSGPTVVRRVTTQIQMTDDFTPTDLGNGVVGISVDPSGGSFQYTYAESESESTTSQTSYQQKLRLTTASLPAGNYHVGWSFEISVDSNNKTAGCRVQIDDTTTICEFFQSPFSNEYSGISGFARVALTAGVHTIDIDYREITGITSIRRARLHIWRVA